MITLHELLILLGSNHSQCTSYLQTLLVTKHIQPYLCSVKGCCIDVKEGAKHYKQNIRKKYSVTQFMLWTMDVLRSLLVCTHRNNKNILPNEFTAVGRIPQPRLGRMWLNTAANKMRYTSVNKQQTLISFVKRCFLIDTLEISVLITRLRFMQNSQGFLLHST